MNNLVLKTVLYARDAERNFPRHEGFAAARRFVVEENPIAGVSAVGLAIIFYDPESV